MKIDIFNAEEKYDILYTDPPWQQGRGGKKAARPNSTGTTVPYIPRKCIIVPWQDAIAKIIRNTSCHVCICTSWHWNTEYIRTFRSEGSQINWQD